LGPSSETQRMPIAIGVRVSSSAMRRTAR
jgi:hypothetical protein